MRSPGIADVAFGFIVVAVIVAVGYFLRRTNVLDEQADRILNNVAFLICNPALLFVVISNSNLATLFDSTLIVMLATMASCAVVLGMALRLMRRKMGVTTTCLMAACGIWVNANNLGLPLATFALGDPSLVAPILLFQLLVLAPLMLLILDLGSGQATFRRTLTQPLRNPIILASAIAVGVAATNADLSPVITLPLELLGTAAIPLMLLAFGASLSGTRPWRVESRGAVPSVIAVTATKTILMPVTAFLAGRYLFDVSDEQLLTIVLIMGLPTAQNAYNFAVRYGIATALVRNIVLFTTLLSAPVIIGLVLVV